jgi:hypothetical protein
MEMEATYTVNVNAGQLWYKMRDLGDATKLDLRGVSRYIQNCGVDLTGDEVMSMQLELDALIVKFSAEINSIKAGLGNCLDKR